MNDVNWYTILSQQTRKPIKWTQSAVYFIMHSLMTLKEIVTADVKYNDLALWNHYELPRAYKDIIYVNFAYGFYIRCFSFRQIIEHRDYCYYSCGLVPVILVGRA